MLILLDRMSCNVGVSAHSFASQLHLKFIVAGCTEAVGFVVIVVVEVGG